MPKPENLPGCAHESWGRCLAKANGQNNPSLAYESMFVPIGEIEGPGFETEKGIGCSVSSDPNAQKECSEFEQRTTEHEERDNNW